MWCVKNKKKKKFKMLLKCSGFDFNIPHDKLEKIINALFRNRNIDVVKYLTEYKADTSSIHNMLSVAAMVGHLHVVKSLVEHYGSLDLNKRDQNDKTPVDYAVACGHLQVVKFLLERGADGNLESLAIKVYFSSCQQNKTTIVKECLDLGVDANIVSDDGQWSGRKNCL